MAASIRWFSAFITVAILLMGTNVQAEDSFFIANNAKARVSLSGTLSRSIRMPSIATVILVTGSGPQDRDETIFGHKPFKTIAEYLVSKGVTVLRYDDRGVGSSTGSPDGTTVDFADDAAAVFDFAKTNLAGPFGFLGHSEGATIGALVAALRSDVGFLIMLGGHAVTGDRLLREQINTMQALSGASAEHIVRNDRNTQRLIDAALGAPDVLVREAEMIRTELGESAGWAAAQAAFFGSAWTRWMLAYDPAPTLAALNIPVLALYGEKDRQVLPTSNRTAAESALASNPRARVEVIPDVNHLFQTAGTGLPSEYAAIREDISSAVLDRITDWLRALPAN
ncbi:MAG: alpha/beta fold hydrolase [Rhodospirillales bacterium]|jgi:pimeloyl-ACP methyl ester carboxylesterase|nr:alpha/beta fold hydrolase [Rhodospirillales bacterium]